MGNSLLSPRNAKVFSYHSPERTSIPSLLPDHQSIKTLIERQDWKGLIQILWDNADWVRSPESYVQGIHPIHRALMVNAPISILETILQIEPNALTLQDDKQSFPIHVAVQYHASIEVLNLICERDEQALERVDAKGRLPLHVAVMHDNHVEMIQFLIQKLPNSVRVRTKVGSLSIHVALEHRASFDVIKLLLEKNPESARQSYNSNLPLHCACESKASLEVFELVLAANTLAPNCYGTDSKLPLHGAVGNKCCFEIIEKLVNLNEEALLHRDKTARMPIHYAIESKVQEDILMLLISRSPESISFRGRGTPGNFPLTMAIENHLSSKIIMELIRVYPTAIKYQTVYGMFPLRSAIKEKMSLEIILALLDYYPEAAGEADEHGRVALHYAASRNYPMILVDALVRSYPPGVSKFDRNNQLPIHLACIRVSDLELLKVLLDRFPQSSKMLDKYQYSPMNYLIENQASLDYFKLLVAADRKSFELAPPDPMIKKEGKLPLHQAIEFQRPFDIIDYLVESYPEGCQIPQSETGKLAIHQAILRPLPIESLLSIEHHYPQAASIQDNDGYFPIHYSIIMKTDSRLIQKLIRAYPSIAQVNHFPLHAAVPPSRRPETKHEGHDELRSISYLEEYDRPCCRGHRLLLHYAVDQCTSPENLAEILKCTMPYNVDGEYRHDHYFSWTHVLSHTRDMYWKSIELVLEPYSSEVITLLADFQDEDTNRALDIATKRCHSVILYRLHYYARYELAIDHHNQTDISMVKYGVDHHRNARDPVALKFMSCSKSFLTEIKLRERMALDSQYVVQMCACHNGEEDYNYQAECRRKRLDQYPYLLVTLRAKRTVEDILRHDNVAGKIEALPRIKEIGRRILQSLKYLHDLELVHGNLSPSHIVDDNGKFKLMDLAFIRSIQYLEEIEVDYGRRAKAYMCPEIAELYFQDLQSRQFPNITKQQKKTLMASPSMDMWSFGAILYFLCTGEPLFLTTPDHSIDDDQLEMLMKWPLFAKNKRMKKIMDVKARNLIEQLLSLEVRLRPNVKTCLQHPFFTEEESQPNDDEDEVVPVRYVGMAATTDVYIAFRFVPSNHSPEVDKDNRLAKIKELKGIDQYVVEDVIHCQDISSMIHQHTVYSCISTDRIVTLNYPSVKIQESELDRIFRQMTQCKSLTVILSRYAVNCDEFSIASLHKNSTLNYFLFEIRLAMELVSRGLLEAGIHIIAFGDLQPPEGTPHEDALLSQASSPDSKKKVIGIESKQDWFYQPFFQHFQQEMTLTAGGCYPTKVSDICMQALEDMVSKLLQKYGFGALHQPMLSIKEMFQKLLQMPMFHVLGERRVAITSTCDDYFVALSSKLGKFRASSQSHNNNNNNNGNYSSRPNTTAFQRMLDVRIPSPDFNRKTPISWFRDREPVPQSPLHHHTIGDIINYAQDGKANSNNSRGGMLSRGGLFSRQGLNSSHGKASPMNASSTKKVSYDYSTMNIGTWNEDKQEDEEQVVEQDVMFFNNPNSTFTSNFQLHQQAKVGGTQVPFFTELVAMDKANSEEMMHFMVEKMESRDNELNNLVLELTLMEERMRLQQLEINRLRYLVQVTSRRDPGTEYGDEE